MRKTFYIGQKIKVKIMENEERRCKSVKEYQMEILALYKHHALCLIKGQRRCYDYWDLERAMNGTPIE